MKPQQSSGPLDNSGPLHSSGGPRRTRGRGALVGLLVVFAVLAVVTIVVTREPVTVDPARFEVPDAFRLFPDIAPEQVIGVRLRNPANENALVIERPAAGGVWSVREEVGQAMPAAIDPLAPVTSLATATANALLTPTPDAAEADLLARTFALMPYLETIATTPETDLRAFGYLPRGLIAIEAVLANGETHALEIGDVTATGSGYYALVDDAPDIYLIPRAPIDYLITLYWRR